MEQSTSCRIPACIEAARYTLRNEKESGIDAPGFPPARLMALAQALEVSVDFLFPPITSSSTAPGAEIALFHRSAGRHRRRQTSRLSREG